MLTWLKKPAKASLRYLPNSLLIKILKERPQLIHSLPEGFRVQGPFYLDDIWINVQRGNVIEEAMITGTYDPDTSRIIRHFVKPGNICIDVGANVGALTMLMAKLIGKSGHVFAFEPGPPYLKTLQVNLELNAFLESSVTVVNMGLSDRNGTLFWRPDPAHPYNAVVINPSGPNFFDENRDDVAVAITTLDEYFFQHDLLRLDFIKIDVESMELEVLRGGRGILSKFRPVVLFESMEWARQGRGFDIFKEIEELFHSLDYGLYDIGQDGGLFEVSSRSLPANTIAIAR
jgi:FkbM family methyltransferase